MADQNTIDTLGTLGNVYTGADLAWAALQDRMTGQPLGTTATTRFGVIGAGFGVAEQLAIWDNSSKSYVDSGAQGDSGGVTHARTQK